jgi:hypothetical protein
VRRLVQLSAAVLMLAAALALLASRRDSTLSSLPAELTPMGAERAGNPAGTIPAWTGGVTEPPAGWTEGEPWTDPFADDPVLFSIDANNVHEYADRLTEGQIALLEAYEDYRLDVYPTRRRCGYDPSVYERVQRNLRLARVDDDCLLRGGVSSPLFPVPQTGCEVIWNGKQAIYNGVWGFDRIEVTLLPTQAGVFVPQKRRQAIWIRSNQPAFPTYDSLEGVGAKSFNHFLAPPKQAGEITLVHALVDGHLEAWTYNPGQRRVRRAPRFEYDNPAPGWQGLVTVDMVNGFVGAPDRYEWKLLGKQELYVPYNAARIHDRSLAYEDIAEPRYPRRDLIRYELHRVWKVEATLRGDTRHVMPRRIFYLDEDSWIIVATLAYDARGQLWKVTEHMPQVIYEIPACVMSTSVYYDLVAGRYLLSPLANEETESDYLAGHRGEMSDSGFTPDDLRRMGTR